MAASEGLSASGLLNLGLQRLDSRRRNVLLLFPVGCQGLGSGRFPGDVPGDNAHTSRAVFPACLLIDVPPEPL